MKYLIDTDRLIDFLNGRSDAFDLLNRLATAGLAISVVTFGEALDDVLHGRDPVRAESVLRSALERIIVLPFTESIAVVYAQIRGDLKQVGRKPSDPDLMIASTARFHNLVLVTRNFDHFRGIPGLELWEQALSDSGDSLPPGAT